MTLRTLLTDTSAALRQIEAPPGAWMLEELIGQIGVTCTPQPLPTKYPRMMAKACFGNTASLVRRYRNLRYCEGFMILPRILIPIHHAWAIDRQNRVIDPTLRDPENCEFIGYPFTLAERRLWLTKHSLSVFDTITGRNAAAIFTLCPSLLDMVAEQYKAVTKSFIKPVEAARAVSVD